MESGFTDTTGEIKSRASVVLGAKDRLTPVEANKWMFSRLGPEIILIVREDPERNSLGKLFCRKVLTPTYLLSYKSLHRESSFLDEVGYASNTFFAARSPLL